MGLVRCSDSELGLLAFLGVVECSFKGGSLFDLGNSGSDDWDSSWGVRLLGFTLSVVALSRRVGPWRSPAALAVGRNSMNARDQLGERPTDASWNQWGRAEEIRGYEGWNTHRTSIKGWFSPGRGGRCRRMWLGGSRSFLVRNRPPKGEGFWMGFEMFAQSCWADMRLMSINEGHW